MKDKKKIIRIDENRILTYTGLAAALLAGNNTHAAVDVTDVSPDTTFADDTFFIDFNDAGPNDVKITHALAGTWGNAKVDPINGTGYIASDTGTATDDALVIGAGDLIDAGLNAWGGKNASFYIGWNNFVPFAGAGDKYIGVKFVLGGNTHYGWIEVNVASKTTQVTVKRFAYETTADLGINAGSETSLPVVLSEFKGSQAGKTILLNWTTDSEIENIGFILERRESGSPEWKQIADFNSDPELAGQGSKVTRTDYSYTDAGVQVGKRYSYRLTDVSYQVMYKGVSRVINDVEVNPIHASSFKLHPSYPNPFNPVTTLGFTLDQAEDVKLSVYNLRGQLIHSLVDDSRPAGFHEVDWNASDVEAGVYFVELIAGEKRQMQKITLLK